MSFEAIPPIRVLVVDDSTVIRGFLSRIVDSEPDMRVVASAFNGRVALDVLQRREVDVVLLDIEMPEMDGLEALPHILERNPKARVIMASSLTEKGAEITLRALSLGASDYVTKPSARSAQGLEPVARELVTKIRALAGRSAFGLGARLASPSAQNGTRPGLGSAPSNGTTSASASPPMAAPATNGAAAPGRAPIHRPGDTPIEGPIHRASGLAPRAIGIASSTGGPNALAKLFESISPDFPLPILIVQHMPPLFTTMLADRITRTSGKSAHEATDGMVIEPGHVYVAPGDYHMTVVKEGGQEVLRLNQEAQENFCRPSADPMLRSMVEVYGGAMWLAVLTGMGHDGLEGARAVAERGGRVIAQDKESCVVWGMPRAVTEAGLPHDILPLDRIGAHLASSAGAFR